MTNDRDVRSRVRAFIFDEFMQRNHAPSATETAQALGLESALVRDMYRELADGHTIVLQSNGDILTANPYAAVPTPFIVETARLAYNGICIWDALGIVANWVATLPFVRRAAIAATLSRSLCERASLSTPAVKSYTSQCRHGIGGRASSSPERQCFFSGRKSMSTAGVGCGANHAARYFQHNKPGGWRTTGMRPIAENLRGGVRRSTKPRPCSHN